MANEPEAEEDRPSNPASLPTVELTKMAAVGDQSAYQGLYDRHFDRVRRITALKIGRLLGDCEHEIEDAVHEAFTDTLLRIQANSIPEIHEESAFRRYIATAAANRVRSVHRHKSAIVRGGNMHKCEHESLFDLLGAAGPGPSTIEAMKEMERDLEARLLALPDHYRKVMELHCLAGMTYEEIAASGELKGRNGDVIDSSERVRMYVHRARLRLDGNSPS